MHSPQRQFLRAVGKTPHSSALSLHLSFLHSLPSVSAQQELVQQSGCRITVMVHRHVSEKEHVFAC
uniref:Uncharacterized protein n=1 Tax=Anguilla anguilla TaxID=7936 RepID=A0A0E9SML8_ANGAN